MKFKDFGIGGSAGTAKDNKRVPGFDDFKSMADMVAKYGDDLRKYFAMAQTHDDLKTAKAELEADEQTNYPDKIVAFFYQERKEMLGPDIKSKMNNKFDDSETTLNQKIKRGQQEQQKTMTRYRPSFN
jgi:hypothetical protein